MRSPTSPTTAATTNEDTPVNVQRAGQRHVRGTPAITGTTNGTNGTVAVNDNGTAGNTADDFVIYTPNADFNGTDSFTYTVTSGGVDRDRDGQRHRQRGRRHRRRQRRPPTRTPRSTSWCWRNDTFEGTAGDHRHDERDPRHRRGQRQRHAGQHRRRLRRLHAGRRLQRHRQLHLHGDLRRRHDRDRDRQRHRQRGRRHRRRHASRPPRTRRSTDQRAGATTRFEDTGDHAVTRRPAARSPSTTTARQPTDGRLRHLHAERRLQRHRQLHLHGDLGDGDDRDRHRERHRSIARRPTSSTTPRPPPRTRRSRDQRAGQRHSTDAGVTVTAIAARGRRSTAPCDRRPPATPSTYTPDADFNGTDSFTYTVTSTTARPRPRPSPSPSTPVRRHRRATAATTNEDTPVTINVLANDTLRGRRRSPSRRPATARHHGTRRHDRAPDRRLRHLHAATPTSTAPTASPTR